MDRSEIERRVIQVVSRVLSIDEDDIQPEHHFVFDLGADSSQSVQLVDAFEEEFQIEMDREAALAVKTVGEAVDFIAEYVNR
ncbi:MAG: acyl carrier protein [Thermoguttaceae bacterium]|nr:acyl carrier protein [Thermoguttaceae bacterium]MDW8078248.1 acyl carrier protein [Thermoguttaceae bacterium]